MTTTIFRAFARAFSAFFLILILQISVIAQDSESPGIGTDSDISDIYRSLSLMETRFEGSPGEKKAAAIIEEYLVNRGIPYTISDLGQESSVHSYSSSIEIVIPGASEDELLMVAPLNSRETSGIPGSGAFNIALALETARVFAKERSELSLRILIAGAEYGDTSSYPIGSKAFLASDFPAENTMVLYLDFNLPPESVIIRAGDRGFVAPYWFLERCLSGLDKNQILFRIRGNENQFYRLGVIENPAPIGRYLEAGYPAISLHDAGGGAGSATGGSETEIFADSFLAFVKNLVGYTETPTEWDRHYLFFKFGAFSLVIGERAYLITLLCIAALLILYPLFFSKRLKSYVVSLINNFWALPMLLVLTFLLLLVGTFLVEGISLLKGFPGYWMKRPAEFFILKLITAVFFFSLISRYLKQIPFPRRGRFYSAAAILILISDVFLLAIVDISLAYYVLWACVWAFFFSLAPNRPLKTLCLLISPVWLIKAAYDMLTIPAIEIAEQMIVTRTSGNLLTAFILFPFLLMLIRLDFMFRHPKRKTKRLLLTVTFIVLGLACGGMITYLALAEPFTSNDPQPITVRETQHLAKSLSYVELSSPASLGDLTFRTPVNTTAISTKSRSYVIETPLISDLLTVDIDVSRFLGRAIYSLNMTAKGLPSSVNISLLSDNEIVVYDSNFPFSFESTNSVTIHIGKYPPNPLVVDFTVPENLAGTAEIQVEYLEPPVPYRIVGENIDVDQQLHVISRTPFGWVD